MTKYDASKPMTLLACRQFNGLGDWIMAVSVLRMVNKQYPNIQVDIDIGKAPASFLEILAYWDVRAAAVYKANPQGYDYYVEHMIYMQPETHKMHLLQSMVDVFNRQTGLELKFDSSLATYQGPEYLDLHLGRSDYVIMVSRGRGASSSYKEWSPTAWSGLSMLLGRHYPIIQVGVREDPPLHTYNRQVLGASLGYLSWLIKNAVFVVSLENGISHMAGHLGTPCYTLYRKSSRCQPVHTQYPRQHPIIICYDEVVFGQPVLNTPAQEVYDQIVQQPPQAKAIPVL